MGGGDSPAPGLESHLRNLIVTNAGANGSISAAQPQPPPSSSYRPPSQDAGLSTFPASLGQSQQTDADLGLGLNYTSHGNGNPMNATAQKPTRRRPNQAQRRQMASQFTIMPDLQPQAPVHSYQPRSAPSYQRHMVTHSQPQAWPVARHSEVPRSHGSWSGPSQSHVSNIRGYSNPSPTMHSTVQSAPHAATRQTTGPSHNYRRPYFKPEEFVNQVNLLDTLCYQVVSSSEIEWPDIATNEAFRQRIEIISREVITRYEQEQNACQSFPPLSVQLKCFGSLSSGFATKASDMDLGLLSPLSKAQPDAPGSPIPRLLEKAFLDAGLGARLLSRTRVPIIKLCESPPEKLRRELLAEREKWEKNVENGKHAGDNDGPTHGDDDEHTCYTVPAGTPLSPGEFEMPSGYVSLSRRFRLQQGTKHSLTAYLGLANRILRRVGGRDVTVSNYKDFTEMDWAILNTVCQAFIQGLSDSYLRERLAKYPSLSPESMSTMPYNRSLLGVSIQAEGEQILQALDLWPAMETLYTLQLPDEQMLGFWGTLRSRSISDIDPVSYTRELQMTLNKIKRMPAVQMLFLQQTQFETPLQYWTRTHNLSQKLSTNPKASIDTVEQAIVSQYVSGICHEDIREAVRNYLQQFPEHAKFQAVGCRHKSFHLARELERTLDTVVYDAASVADIKQYIGLLLSPLHQDSTGLQRFVISVPPELSSLLKRMTTLKGPHTMAPHERHEKYRDPLEFPKMGVGVQCDINFSAHLALQNTQLLRCYSHTDPRVRPMVLFIKHWAKVRGINSGYRGTLSSYGYVLMVLHYLVNVAQPFVCPNLQQLARPPAPNLSPAEIDATVTCKGYNVQFWRNEEEIRQLARANQLNRNAESIGHLLRGFFEYFAQGGMMSNDPGKGFDWGREVISLRTHGGLLTKQEKGWTEARTVYEVQNAGLDAGQSTGEPSATRGQPETSEGNAQPIPARSASRTEDVKEVRLRYLFAIEDPFEVDHNVARTVTHRGIVSIRDELRRAWRIIRAAGNGNTQEDLLHDANEVSEGPTAFLKSLADIHGLEESTDVAMR